MFSPVKTRGRVMNSFERSEKFYHFVSRSPSNYTFLPARVWPAPVTCFQPGFSIAGSSLSVLEGYPHQLPLELFSTNANRSFLIKDILGPSNSVEGFDTGNQREKKNPASKLQALPASMLSYYALPTQKEIYQQLRRPRSRTIFTQSQLDELETKFSREKYLGTLERTEFARILGLAPLQVRKWFQNRRVKWRKDLQKNDPNWKPTRAKCRHPNSCFFCPGVNTSAEPQ